MRKMFVLRARRERIKARIRWEREVSWERIVRQEVKNIQNVKGAPTTARERCFILASDGVESSPGVGAEIPAQRGVVARSLWGRYCVALFVPHQLEAVKQRFLGGRPVFQLAGQVHLHQVGPSTFAFLTCGHLAATDMLLQWHGEG